MTDNPCNCLTCGNRFVNPNDDWYCLESNGEIAGEIEVETTKQYGCLSHTKAKDTILAPFIEELDEIADKNENPRWELIRFLRRIRPPLEIKDSRVKK